MRRFLTIAAAGMFLLLGVSCEKNEGSCEDRAVYTAPAAVLKAAEPFYCEEMEDLWDVDAKEVVGNLMKIRLQFQSIDNEQFADKVPQTISVGNLQRCVINKAPSNTNCMDTKELYFDGIEPEIKEIFVWGFSVNSHIDVETEKVSILFDNKTENEWIGRFSDPADNTALQINVTYKRIDQ